MFGLYGAGVWVVKGEFKIDGQDGGDGRNHQL